VAAGAESPEIVIEPDLYEARPADLLGRVGELPAEAASVLVIGHNPTVQQAAVDLAGTGSPEQYRRLKEKYPTAALASLLLAGADWSGVRPGAGELDLFVVPKDLPDD
jgi:phosphohistidine phosphatase